MIRKEAKDLLPIIQAFAEGKTIQQAGGRGWFDVDSINFDLCKYRIKPEPKYRPFANAEECWAEMQKHQPFGWLYNKPNNQYYYITTLDNYGIVTTPFDEVYYEKYTDFIKRKTTFADGTPFGIKE